MIRLMTLLILLLPNIVKAETMRLAVTTSFHNSGLADVLLPEIAVNTGIDVQLLVVGTGQALRLGRAGDVDAVLVHSRQAEEDFVAQGHAPHRREIMFNDFVIVGPTADPAAVRSTKTAVAALAALAKAEHPFVSRGDDSGTHRRELGLWDAAKLDPAQFSSWYRPVGAGMGASLNIAAGMDAYVITDRGSWLNFGNRRDLVVLFEGDPVLRNQYAYLPVSEERHAHVNAEAAQAVEAWLTSDAARTLIDGYQINGDRLFTFNAKVAR